MSMLNSERQSIDNCIRQLSDICEVRLQEPLAEHSTLRIGGPARAFALPESCKQCIDCMQCLEKYNCPYRVIGNGSNLLFADGGYAGVIICTARMRSIEFLSDTMVRADAGLSNQLLIATGHRCNLGGLEFLASVPGTIGGAVAMNAGRGWMYRQTIHRYIDSVDIFCNGERRSLSRSECAFGYRHSIFRQHTDMTILSVCLRLRHVSQKKGQMRIQKRLQATSTSQDRSKPSAGTVFCKGFRRKALSDPCKRIGDAALSSVNTNWIMNMGHASTSDVLQLMEWMEDEHVVAGYKKPVREIEYIADCAESDVGYDS